MTSRLGRDITLSPAFFQAASASRQASPGKMVLFMTERFQQLDFNKTAGSCLLAPAFRVARYSHTCEGRTTTLQTWLLGVKRAANNRARM